MIKAKMYSSGTTRDCGLQAGIRYLTQRCGLQQSRLKDEHDKVMWFKMVFWDYYRMLSRVETTIIGGGYLVAIRI